MRKDTVLENIKIICKRVICDLFEQKFDIRVERDNVYKEKGRIFLQITYKTKCNKSKKMENWHGRKFYLSEHMTEDEVIKTLFLGFKLTVEHEVMESFKVDGKILFNPHLNYTELLAMSHKEVSRK